MTKIKLTADEVKLLEKLYDNDFHVIHFMKSTICDVLERNNINYSELKKFILKNSNKCRKTYYSATVKVSATYSIDTNISDYCLDKDNDIETVRSEFENALNYRNPEEECIEYSNQQIDDIEQIVLKRFKLKPESYDII